MVLRGYADFNELNMERYEWYGVNFKKDLKEMKRRIRVLLKRGAVLICPYCGGQMDFEEKNVTYVDDNILTLHCRHCEKYSYGTVSFVYGMLRLDPKQQLFMLKAMRYESGYHLPVEYRMGLEIWLPFWKYVDIMMSDKTDEEKKAEIEELRTQPKPKRRKLLRIWRDTYGEI